MEGVPSTVLERAEGGIHIGEWVETEAKNKLHRDGSIKNEYIKDQEPGFSVPEKKITNNKGG